MCALIAGTYLPWISAGTSAFFIIGRIIYNEGYKRHPRYRVVGAILGDLAILAYFVEVIVAIVFNFLEDDVDLADNHAWV